MQDNIIIRDAFKNLKVSFAALEKAIADFPPIDGQLWKITPPLAVGKNVNGPIVDRKIIVPVRLPISIEATIEALTSYERLNGYNGNYTTRYPGFLLVKRELADVARKTNKAKLQFVATLENEIPIVKHDKAGSMQRSRTVREIIGRRVDRRMLDRTIPVFSDRIGSFNAYWKEVPISSRHFENTASHLNALEKITKLAIPENDNRTDPYTELANYDALSQKHYDTCVMHLNAGRYLVQRQPSNSAAVTGVVYLRDDQRPSNFVLSLPMLIVEGDAVTREKFVTQSKKVNLATFEKGQSAKSHEQRSLEFEPLGFCHLMVRKEK